MATAKNLQPVEFTAFHLFAGIGGGSLGAARARVSWLGVNAHIRNVGAVDVDPQACEDYRNLTGSPISCMDLFSLDQYRDFHGCEPPSEWREATTADIRAAAGENSPDIVFTSPPCKGFSSLLPSKSAASAKYQALNRLTIRSIRLILDAFSGNLPAVILLENVPRIKTRGSHLLAEIRHHLKKAGYVINDADHDCGEIGGLGQRRRRFLLIARHPAKCRPFIYQPPVRPLKTIGDVISPLPFPDDPTMGPMHRLPRLKWLTWLRLALIPAGGDWRDLQKITTEEYRIVSDSRPNLYGVADWNGQMPAVTGSCSVSSSNCPGAINDPRLPKSKGVYPGRFGVKNWNGQASADTRLNSDSRSGYMHVLGMDEVSPAIIGAARTTASNGPSVAADHRLGCTPHNGSYGVMGWAETASAVIGSADCHAAKAAVADIRIPGNNDRLDPPPVIISLDGTWHRPLTTLELLVLQSFPARFADGRPIVLAGKSDRAWRERIGNAVPPDASRRMHEQIMLPLLQHVMGETFLLVSHETPIWLRPPSTIHISQ